MLSQAIKWPVSSYNHTCNYTGKWYYLHQLYIHQMFLWCFAASTVHSEMARCSLWRLCFHCLHRLNMLWAAVTMQLILVLLLVKPLILPVFDWSALVISLFSSSAARLKPRQWRSQWRRRRQLITQRRHHESCHTCTGLHSLHPQPAVPSSCLVSTQVHIYTLHTYIHFKYSSFHVTGPCLCLVLFKENLAEI